MSNSKPRGYFKNVLALDSETTGLCFNVDDPSADPSVGIIHQAVSWGMVVADANTFEPIDELYVEIKWNQDSYNSQKIDPDFGKKAQSIHGLTYDYLEENGIDEEEAVLKIGTFLMKHFGPETNIPLLGHNVITFDIWYLKRMMRNHGIELKFGNRHLDSFAMGFGTTGAYNSDDLFEVLKVGDARGNHNALEDAKMALDSFKNVRTLWSNIIGVNAYD